MQIMICKVNIQKRNLLKAVLSKQMKLNCIIINKIISNVISPEWFSLKCWKYFLLVPIFYSIRGQTKSNRDKFLTASCKLHVTFFVTRSRFDWFPGLTVPFLSVFHHDISTRMGKQQWGQPWPKHMHLQYRQAQNG